MENDNFFDRHRQASASLNAPETLREDPQLDSTATADEAPPAAVSESSQAPELGRLPAEARKALVNLMRHGCVLASQKSLVFETLCRHQTPLRQHLADMYLRLILDERNGVAFIANSEANVEEDESGESARLIIRRSLTLYDTLLLLVLRKYYQERETQGEQKIIVDIERIEAGLTPFLPLTNSSRSDRRKLAPSLKRLLEKKLISVVRGNQDRFEISPLIRYVVSAEFLQRMLDEYLHLAKGASPSNRGEEDHG